MKKSGGNSTLTYFDSINRFYSSLHNTDSTFSIPVNDCFALQLAEVITEKITTERIIINRDRSFGTPFYNQLADTLKSTSMVNDSELLVIYLKQMVNIMRSAELISDRDGQAFITEIFSGKDILYPVLLRAFWNECDWRIIFPSSPEAAEKIHDNRDAFLELIQATLTEVSVEELAADFFSATGICETNDYFMISFVDFYLLTWLKHFGIIEYNVKEDHDIVLVTVNDYGRKVLNSFL
ncbi:MAG TPA: hypothetical protein PK514_00525 [Spirochaetota bacterium]|nr:hypothetical protein [Spirochaetota bacterium]